MNPSFSPAAAPHLVACWNFNDETGRDEITRREDVIHGPHSFTEGVTGRALCSDEFGTLIQRAAAEAPVLNPDGFSVEAWIAPHAYPWNYCPILTQRDGDRAFYFGINYQGQLQLHATVGERWMFCESPPALPGLSEVMKFAGEGGTPETIADFGDARPAPTVPLLIWTHVAGSLAKDGTMQLYVNGKSVDSTCRVSQNPETCDPDIAVCHALYGKIGTADQCADVTSKLQAQVEQGDLVLRAGPDLAGRDPAPGEAKHLQVIWSLNQGAQVETVAEGGTIDLGTLRTRLRKDQALNLNRTYPAESGLTLLRTTKPVLPLFLARDYGNGASFCSFDGLVDEVMLYDGALDADSVRDRFRKAQPRNPKPLQLRRMPTAQDRPGSFGAFYTRFDYDESWDRTRRMGPAQDLFVRFEHNPCTFVAWNGTVYPVWYPDGGEIGQMFEAFEIWSREGCHEAMMDRRNEYCSWKILENTPARIVLHWRHGLVSRAGTLASVDPVTGWSDWVDDYYTIYPDTVCARRTVLWSSVPCSRHSYAQDDSVLQPGRMPWEVYDPEPMHVANLRGQETIVTMGKGNDGYKDKGFEDPPVIQLHKFNSRYSPFMIAAPNEVFSGVWTNNATWPWNLPCWHHWPTAQLIDSDGSCTFLANGRPTSSCLTNGWGYGQINEEAMEFTDNTLTRYALNGMTDGSAADLAPLARAWRQPPRMSTDSPGFVSHGFSLAENAFHVRRTGKHANDSLRLNFDASETSPLVHPAVVIQDWGENSVIVEMAGDTLIPGESVQLGFHRTPQGVNLVLWIQRDATKPVQVSVQTSSETRAS